MSLPYFSSLSKLFLNYSGPSAFVYGFWNQFVSFYPQKAACAEGPSQGLGTSGQSAWSPEEVEEHLMSTKAVTEIFREILYPE